MTDPETYTELFTVIADYCTARGWVPVGQRVFTVGPFTITVNGRPEAWRNIPGFHATVTHATYLGVILVNPFRGQVAGGGPTFEADAIAAVRAAIGQEEPA